MSIILPKIYPIINCDQQALAYDQFFKLHTASHSLFQLRAKILSDFEFTKFIEKLFNQLTALGLSSIPQIIINDRIEIAKEFPVAGVHLGQDDISPLVAREVLGPEAVLGFSTHTLTQVQAAQALPVDYLGFGPIFLSKSKHGHAEPTGLDNLTQALSISKLPIVAIGGINQSNLEAVYETGVSSVAMISGLRVSTCN